MTGTRWTGAFLAAIVVALPMRAAADMVVLESYVGNKPSNVEAVMAPLVEEVRQQGLIAGPALAEQIEARISLAAPVLSAAELSEVQRQIDEGAAKYRQGHFEAAIEELERGAAGLQRAPATMVANQSTRDVMMDGLIYLALSNSRLGRSVPATQAMAELIRSFPDKEISSAKHGPEPRKLFREVKADLGARGDGKLKVTVDDAKTVIFVNERYAGVGEVVVDNLLPGKYRVLVQQGERRGRLHEIDVEPGAQAQLSITWELDNVLHTRDFVGMVFENEASQAEMEAAYATRIARALHASGVAVLGVRDYHGRRSLVGTLYSLDSTRPIRTAALALAPVSPTEKNVRAMGRFLAGDESASQLFPNLAQAEKPTSAPAPAPPPPAHHDHGGSGLRWAGIVTAGVGVLAVGLGAKFGLDARQAAGDVGAKWDPDRDEEGKAAERNMFIFYGAGAAALVGGSVLYFLGARKGKVTDRRITVIPSVSSSSTALMVSGRF